MCPLLPLLLNVAPEVSERGNPGEENEKSTSRKKEVIWRCDPFLAYISIVMINTSTKVT